MRIESKRIAVVVVASVLATLGSSNPLAAAITDCSSSPFVVDATTGNRTLSPNDVLTTDSSSTCVEMHDGRNLDLNGATIECSDSACGRAVRAFDSGSVLQGGTIDGPFTHGADDAAEVKNMLIDGTTDVAIGGSSHTKKVHGNVIINAGGDAIQFTSTALTTSTSFVRDNFIDGTTDGFTGRGIVVCGTDSGSGPKVENNYIRDEASGIDCLGTTCAPDDHVRLLANIVDSSVVTPIDDCTSADVTIEDNLCDDATNCPTPEAPFQLP